MKTSLLKFIIGLLLTSNLLVAGDIVTFKTSYNNTEDIWIELPNGYTNSNDWIGIYPKDANNDWVNVVTWVWANDMSNTSNGEPNWYKFKDIDSDYYQTVDKYTQALPAGSYEARYFLNNTFVVEAAVSFTVGAKIDSWYDSYPVNNDVWIELPYGHINDTDWIGIYPKNSTTDWENVVSWVWSKDTTPTQNGEPNWYKFVDIPAGEYEARFFYDNSYDIAASTQFSVQPNYPSTTTLQYRATDLTILKPALGGTVLDNIFNTKITRIDKNGSKYASYPKVQSWNKDMTLFRIGNRLYDADTLEESDITKYDSTESAAYSTLGSRSSDYFRWSNVDSNVFYVLNSSYKFLRATITGDNVDCSDVLDAFSDFELVHLGPYEGNIDYADKYVVFVAKKSNDTTFYVILYNIQTRTREWVKVLSSQSWVWSNSSWEPTTLDWLSVSPSGSYIVFNNRNGNTDGMYRYDINFANKVKLQYNVNGTLLSSSGHGDLGYDIDGNEVFVQFVSGEGVYSFNLDNPTELGTQLLNSPYGGGHISCRNTERPGWCYVTTIQEGYKQVFALKLDGTGNMNVQNFSQTHIGSNFYETYGAPSPNGAKMIFNSDWDNVGTIDTFIVEAQ